MRIATNVSELFTDKGKSLQHEGREIEFVDIRTAESFDAVLLVLGKIIRDGEIPQIEELLAFLEKNPKLPCYVLGCNTAIPSTNFKRYKSKKRDEVVRKLFEQVLTNSASIGVSSKVTHDYFVEFLGFRADKVDIISEKAEMTAFIKKNKIDFMLPFAERIVDFLPRFVTACYPDFVDMCSEYKTIDEYISLHSTLREVSEYDTIIIGPPFLIEREDRIYYTADVFIEGVNQRIYLETDKEMQEHLLTERLDAFVFGLLPYAMRNYKDILCLAPVTEEFLHNLEVILIPLLTKYDKMFHSTKITAPMDSSALPCAGAVGTAISCGVDSFYTIQHYIDSPFPSMNLTHLFIANACYSGNAKKNIDSRAESAAKELGLPLVRTNTNLADLFTGVPHIYIQQYRAFFSILALRKLWKIYYFSTAWDLSEFSLKNASTKETSQYELLLSKVLSTHGFRVYCGGATADRGEKTRSIEKYSITHKYLHICLHPADEANCGKCRKCMRTLIELDMNGTLDLYRECFDIEEYHRTRLDKFVFLVKNRESKYMKKAYQHFLETEPELMRQAGKKVARGILS